MSELSLRPIEVTDDQGNKMPAALIVCACGNCNWHIFVLDGAHEHIQCLGCGVSYCMLEGPCGATGDS